MKIWTKKISFNKQSGIVDKLDKFVDKTVDVAQFIPGPDDDIFMGKQRYEDYNNPSSKKNKDPLSNQSLDPVAIQTMLPADIINFLKANVISYKWQEIETKGFQGMGWPAPKALNLLTQPELIHMSKELGMVSPHITASSKKWIQTF